MGLAERLWSKVDIRGPDECWPWKPEHSHHPVTGRGTIRPGGTASTASRVLRDFRSLAQGCSAHLTTRRAANPLTCERVRRATTTTTQYNAADGATEGSPAIRTPARNLAKVRGPIGNEGSSHRIHHGLQWRRHGDAAAQRERDLIPH